MELKGEKAYNKRYIEGVTRMFPYFEQYTEENKKRLARVRLQHRGLNPTEFALYMNIIQCSSFYTKQDLFSFSMKTPLIDLCVNNDTFDIMVIILNACRFSNIDYESINLPHHTEILHKMTTIRDIYMLLKRYVPPYTEGTILEKEIDFAAYH